MQNLSSTPSNSPTISLAAEGVALAETLRAATAQIRLAKTKLLVPSRLSVGNTSLHRRKTR